MVLLRKADKYRFTLQWGNHTVEQIQAGEFLESLGNRKSSFIVMVVGEYLRQHPEALSQDVKVTIYTQSTLSREQMLAEVRSAVRGYVEEAMSSMVPGSTSSPSAAPASGPTEQDLDNMLANLDFFS